MELKEFITKTLLSAVESNVKGIIEFDIYVEPIQSTKDHTFTVIVSDNKNASNIKFSVEI